MFNFLTILNVKTFKIHMRTCNFNTHKIVYVILLHIIFNYKHMFFRMLSIKYLKPKKNSRYKQGVRSSKIFKKYISKNNEPVIYRSGLELEFINYCENNPSIKQWASEPIQIKYFSRLNNKIMNYYPDFIVEKTNGSRIIVEIKPLSQTNKPTMRDNRWSKETWIKNIDKWMSAYKFAKEHNMSFAIVSENLHVQKITEEMFENYIQQFKNK